MPLLVTIEEMAAVAAVDWDSYRSCSICRSSIGEACRALSGRVAGGRPDGVSTPLATPHAARKRRTGR